MVLHEIADVHIHCWSDIVLGPSYADLTPIDEVLKRKHKIVREDERNATCKEAFIKMIRPRRCALWDQTEVGVSHDVKIFLHETAHTDIGKLRKLQQLATDSVILVVIMVGRKAAMEVEQ